MIDNIPYRHGEPDSTCVFMENFTDGREFYVVTQPSYMMSDPEEHKNGPYVTSIYSYNLQYECTEKCLEYLFSDTEEEAEKTHDELLDKWDNIHYSKPCEVVDAEVQGW